MVCMDIYKSCLIGCNAELISGYGGTGFYVVCFFVPFYLHRVLGVCGFFSEQCFTNSGAVPCRNVGLSARSKTHFRLYTPPKLLHPYESVISFSLALGRIRCFPISAAVGQPRLEHVRHNSKNAPRPIVYSDSASQSGVRES